MEANSLLGLQILIMDVFLRVFKGHFGPAHGAFWWCIMAVVHNELYSLLSVFFVGQCNSGCFFKHSTSVVYLKVVILGTGL